MALSHLIQLKPRSIFREIIFRQPTRWCSSTTTKSKNQKRSTTLREEKASAVVSFVNKYMESHPGIFPSVSLVRNEIGGSYYIVKDVMLNLKENIMRNPQLQINPLNSGPNKCDVGASESISMNTLSSESNISTSTTAISEKSLSEETKDMASMSEATRTFGNSGSSKMVAAEKLGSTESESQSIMMASNSEPNLGSENETGERIGSSSNHAPKDMGITKLLQICLNRRPDTNFKQLEEGFADTFLRSEVDPSSKSAQSQTRKILQQSSEKVTASTGCKNHRPDRQAESSALPDIASEGGTMSSTPAEGSKKVIRLANPFTKRNNHPEEGETMTETKSDILTQNIFKDSSSDSPKEVVAKGSGISGLFHCLKDLPQGNNNSTKIDQIRNSNLIGGVQSQGKLQPSYNIGKTTFSNGQPIVKKNEKEPGLETEVPSKKIKSTSSTKGPSSTSMKVVSSSECVLDQNKVILRFLPFTTKESDIAGACKNRIRDDILKIEFSYVKQSTFRIAHVYFKTRDGLREALKQTCLIIKGSSVTIEAASSLDSMSDRICIPDLIGDPDAPAMLLKTPSKTVMIKDLTRDIRSHHVAEALLPFCKSDISAFFFGSTTSVAYVEFDTEEGKERALAKHSIFIQGKPLFIFRVDAPRTTVIRLSNIKSMPDGLKRLVPLCKSCGQIKCVVPRDADNVDVHFLITEWPHMLKILNRLNGMLLDGQRLRAEPAPVFPPEVILALWGWPEERRRLKGLMHNLFQKIEENEIVNLAARYYADDKP